MADTCSDGYEKARFHFLVMRTFSSASLTVTELTAYLIIAARDPFKLSSGGEVPRPFLSSLSTLLKSPHALEVLNALKKSADDVKVSSLDRRRKCFPLISEQMMIQDEMRKTDGWTWQIGRAHV